MFAKIARKPRLQQHSYHFDMAVKDQRLGTKNKNQINATQGEFSVQTSWTYSVEARTQIL